LFSANALTWRLALLARQRGADALNSYGVSRPAAAAALAIIVATASLMRAKCAKRQYIKINSQQPKTTTTDVHLGCERVLGAGSW